ncbi:hypothetical protein ABT160_45980 [Streptomyces sp. NPDC001941]|uniref:hypothetical protein n=1 Tax=Streptomyces sp. NPDC001941 TaxID=3154659 RepID=UPI00332536FC
MTSTPRYQVHISSEGQLFLDNEPCIVPTGVDPSQVAVHILHIQAAGSGQPSLVHVRDERTASRFDMQVMPDGTTQPAESPKPPPPATDQPTDSLRERLIAAQDAARAHNLTTAIPEADDILQQLSSRHGETAPATLEAAQFRADLAYLNEDFAFATASWTWLALAWFDRLGPGKRRTQIAAQNAAEAWMRLPLHEARHLASDLVNMLVEVAAPERTAGIRTMITERLRPPAQQSPHAAL